MSFDDLTLTNALLNFQLVMFNHLDVLGHILPVLVDFMPLLLEGMAVTTFLVCLLFLYSYSKFVIKYWWFSFSRIWWRFYVVGPRLYTFDGTIS